MHAITSQIQQTQRPLTQRAHGEPNQIEPALTALRVVSKIDGTDSPTSLLARRRRRQNRRQSH